MPLGPLWQNEQRFVSGIALPNLSTSRTNSALPRSWAGVRSPISLLPPIGSRCRSADIHNQVRQGEVIKVLGAPEIFLGSRAALGREVGIAAVPFERFSIFHSFDGPVVDNIAAKPVRLKIPGEPVEGGIDMAVRAPNLALEGISGCIKRLLAVAQVPISALDRPEE